MWMKTRALEDNPALRGRSVHMLTATPVTNKLTEMYVFLRYLGSAQLEQMGYRSLKQWKRDFVQESWKEEITATGTVQAKLRERSYRNLYQLRNQWRSVADVKTKDDINLHVPPLVDENGTPLAKGQFNVVRIPMPARMRDFINEAAVRADAIVYPLQKGHDNMLSIINDMRGGELSARAVARNDFNAYHDNTQEWEGDNKVERAAQIAYDRYRRHEDKKGTFLIFADRAVRNPQSEAEGEYDEHLWNVYDGIIDRIEELAAADGISDIRDEIAVIQDASGDPSAKQEILDKTNRGEVRILLGSTPTLGEGVNVQSRVTGALFLDVGWNPNDLVQRLGRIERQGNDLFEEGAIPGVEPIVLVYEGGPGHMMWEYNERKAGGIEQLLDEAEEGGRPSSLDAQGESELFKSILIALYESPITREVEEARSALLAVEGQKREYDRQRYAHTFEARRLEDALNRRRREVSLRGRIWHRLTRGKRKHSVSFGAKITTEMKNLISKADRRAENVVETALIGSFGPSELLTLRLDYAKGQPLPFTLVLENEGLGFKQEVPLADGVTEKEARWQAQRFAEVLTEFSPRDEARRTRELRARQQAAEQASEVPFAGDLRGAEIRLERLNDALYEEINERRAKEVLDYEGRRDQIAIQDTPRGRVVAKLKDTRLEEIIARSQNVAMKAEALVRLERDLTEAEVRFLSEQREKRIRRAVRGG